MATTCPTCGKVVELPETNFSAVQHECETWFWTMPIDHDFTKDLTYASKKLGVYAQGVLDEFEVDLSNIRKALVCDEESGKAILFVQDTTPMPTPEEWAEVVKERTPLEAFANTATSLKKAIYGKAPEPLLAHAFERVENALAALKKESLKNA